MLGWVKSFLSGIPVQVVRKQEPSRIGVPCELDAEQLRRLALVPLGGAEEVRDGGNARAVARAVAPGRPRRPGIRARTGGRRAPVRPRPAGRARSRRPGSRMRSSSRRKTRCSRSCPGRHGRHRARCRRAAAAAPGNRARRPRQCLLGVHRPPAAGAVLHALARGCAPAAS